MKIKIQILALLLFTIIINATQEDIDHIQIKRSFDKQNVIPIAIIGSGPAGLTAGMYGARAGIHTVVFTGDLPGGQLTLTGSVENWPGVRNSLGYEIVSNLEEQARDFGAILIEETIDYVDFSTWPFILYTSSGEKINALSVIIATGAAPRKLGVPGELEYWGKGVTSCAVCDCHLFKGKDVVVVGGGNAAIEEAMQLAPYAKNITILVRSDRMRAEFSMRQKLEEFHNIKVAYNKQVVKVIGDGEVMTGLEIKDSETGEVETMNVQGLFLAIGQNPNTNLFKDKLELSRFGYIILEGRSQETSVSGIFAAGDVADSEYRQAVVACGTGCMAALDAVKWLREIGLTERTANILLPNYYAHIKE